MNRISDNRKCMSSLAVFRDLYNKKRDIYSVIAEFVKLAIAEKAFTIQINIRYIIPILYSLSHFNSCYQNKNGISPDYLFLRSFTFF